MCPRSAAASAGVTPSECSQNANEWRTTPCPTPTLGPCSPDVAVLTAPDDYPDVSDVDRAHAAAWLHRGLWAQTRKDPTMANLRALTSPTLPRLF